MAHLALMGRADGWARAGIGLSAALSALLLSSACSIGDDGDADDTDGGGQAGSATGSGGSNANPQGGKSSSAGSKASGGAAGSISTGGTTSTPVTTDFADAQVYVDAHNAVRAAVEPPSGYSGTWQPLPPVSWSDEVATTAQEWANHLRDTMNCDLEHAQDSGYGENLAGGTNVGAQKAVDMWAGEKKNYTYSPEYDFMSNTGHYTQIVWRKSTHIGCASAKCSNGNVVVCRYDPPGNFIGGEIF